MTLKGIVKKTNKNIWYIRRWLNKFRGTDWGGCSIISCNCTAGLVLSEYHIRFNTPTINLFMNAPDFLKFAKDMDHYLQQHMTPISSDEKYPVSKLDDLTIHGVHYHSHVELATKWDQRKKRINRDKLFFIFSERDGFEDWMFQEIAHIPYPKVVFSKDMHPEYDFVCTIPGCSSLDQVKDVTEFIGITGKRIYSYYPFNKRLTTFFGK